jgi:hypothetical protein
MAGTWIDPVIAAVIMILLILKPPQKDKIKSCGKSL